MNAPQIIRKLSAARIVGNVKAYAPRQGADGSLPKDVVPLYRIFGSANNVRTGQSDNGPFTALVGRFEAVSLTPDPETGEVSGEQFIAPECFLPGATHDILVSELVAKDENGKRKVESLDFAFEVGIKASKNPIGYEFVCMPLVQHTTSDPLAALRSKIAELPSVLPKSAGALPAPENKQVAAGGKKK